MIHFFFILALVFEALIILLTLLVYLVILSVFWHGACTMNEELIIALFSPLFILLLLYGRTTTCKALGIVGPFFAYFAFYCYPRK